MKFIGLLVSCTLCLFLSVFAFSEGSFQKENRQIEVFEKIFIKGSMDVFLKQGDGVFLEVEANDSDIDDVNTEVKDRTLSISLKKDSALKERKLIKVFVTAPKIFEIQKKVQVVLDQKVYGNFRR